MRFGLISAIFVHVAMIGAVASAGAAHAAKPPAHRLETTGAGTQKAGLPAPHGLAGLLHARPEQVTARLGEPAIARAEGKGAFWTYRAPRCALYIFFKDEDGGLKVSGAAAGPRKRGVAFADLDTCLAELEGSQGEAPAQ
jgi:hypothetical protein